MFLPLCRGWKEYLKATTRFPNFNVARIQNKHWNLWLISNERTFNFRRCNRITWALSTPLDMATVTLTASSARSRGTSPNISPKRSHSPIRNLQCSLCLQSFNDARILPCLHSFCADCLEKSCLQYSETAPSVYCPVCMDETLLNSRGIEGLPKNLYVKHLLDLQDGAGNDTRSCDLCAVKDLASKYCQTCRYNLCTLCSQAHQRQRKTSQHKLVRLENMSPSLVLDSVVNGNSTKSKLLFCKTHRGEAASVYCEDCSFPVCQKCTLTKHCGHTFNLLDTVSRQQEEVLRNLITRTKPFLVSVGDSLKNIEFTTRSVEERAHIVATEICDSIDERMKALQVSLATCSHNCM